MSTYPKHVWDQLRSTTHGEFEKALQRDGWVWQQTSGAEQIYMHPDRPEEKNMVSVHSHPGKVIRPGTLKSMLEATGWDEEDLVRVKLIKRQKGKRRDSDKNQTEP